MDATLILIDSDAELVRAALLSSGCGSRTTPPTWPGSRRKRA